jgi:hypothetical protein
MRSDESFISGKLDRHIDALIRQDPTARPFDAGA